MQLNKKKKKKKKPNQKTSRRSKLTFLQRRHTDGQETHEKMLNIIHYYRNVNQNAMRYHLTPIRIAIIKESTNNKS